VPPGPDASTLSTLRRLILVLLGLGLAATALELWLIGHHEDARQIVPLVVTVPALATLVWHAAAPGRASTTAFRLAALALIVSGVAGIYLHYLGNREFQLELDPSLAGLALMEKILHAKAPPALAPGHMALLGLLCLAATYRQTDHTSKQGERER
jgi:glucose uptake protein GlcU